MVELRVEEGRYHKVTLQRKQGRIMNFNLAVFQSNIKIVHKNKPTVVSTILDLIK